MNNNLGSDTNNPSVLLMHRPRIVRVEPPAPGKSFANEFAAAGFKRCQQDPVLFDTEGQAQFTALQEQFRLAGAVVRELPQQDNPIMVFTADPSFSLVAEDGRRTVIFSHFTNERRQKEVEPHLDFLSSQAADGDLLVSSTFRCEGTGDNIYDRARDIVWSGYAPALSTDNASAGRGDLRAHDFIREAMRVDVVSIPVQKPFFHLDTPFAPLPGGHVLCYEGGMKPEGYGKMLANAFERFGMREKDYLIKVDEQDALSYACNVRSIGNEVIIPKCSDKLLRQIADAGYSVRPVNLGNFIGYGGGPHCMSNNITETRVRGGNVARLGYKDAGPR